MEVISHDVKPMHQDVLTAARNLADIAKADAPKGFKWQLVPDYPTGEVVGACICGSWPGGKCLRCEPVFPTPP